VKISVIVKCYNTLIRPNHLHVPKKNMAQVKRKAEEDPDELRSAAVGEGKETKQAKKDEEEEQQTVMAGSIFYFMHDDAYGAFNTSAKYTERFLEAAIERFTHSVEIDPKTGKGKFVLSSSKQGMRRLDKEQVNLQLDVMPHILDINWTEMKDGVYLGPALTWIRKFYKDNISKPREHVLWLIDEDRLPSLHEFMMIGVHTLDYTPRVIGRTMIQLMKSYVTGDRKYYGRDHFWMMIYGMLDTIDLVLLRDEANEDWTIQDMLAHIEQTKELASKDAYRSAVIPFLDYVSTWIKANPLDDDTNRFLMALDEKIFGPMKRTAQLYLNRVSNEYFRDWNESWPDLQELLERKADSHLSRLRFLLCPGVEQAVGVDLPSWMLNKDHIKDVPLTKASKFILDMYRSAYSPDAKDRMPIWDNDHDDDKVPLSSRGDLVRLVGVLCMTWQDEHTDGETGRSIFEIKEDGTRIMTVPTIESFMIWLVLVHPYWCKHERVAVIGTDTQNDPSMNEDLEGNRLFMFMKGSRQQWFDNNYDVYKPEGMKTFFYNFLGGRSDDVIVATNKELLEWLVKKHPEYRKKQMDTYLFDTKLGMIQQWVKQTSPETGQEYTVKERKNTYLALGPPERKFSLYEAKQLDPIKKKQTNVPVKPRLPPDMYKHISTFYTQGRAHHNNNKRLLIDSDSESDGD
jgi:hypothetical protein